MFEKNYTFQGEHAKYVKNLKDNANLFERYVDVLILAPIIGFLTGNKSKLKTGNESASILAEQIIKESDKLEFNYQLITILDDNFCSDSAERMNRAFRYKSGAEYEKSIKNYNDYIRGGVEYLHKKLFGNDIDIETYSQDEIIENMFELIDEYQKDFTENYDVDIDINKLLN
ncbi:MAG: hypothetical protein ACOCV1_04500 [Bacillota bacterium]